MSSLAEPSVCGITTIRTLIHPIRPAMQGNENLINKTLDRRVPLDHGQFAFHSK